MIIIDKKIKQEFDFISDGNRWHVTVFEDDTAILKTYNKKYKWWITVHTIDKYNHEAEQKFIKMLGQEYVNRVVSQL